MNRVIVILDKLVHMRGEERRRKIRQHRLQVVEARLAFVRRELEAIGGYGTPELNMELCALLREQEILQAGGHIDAITLFDPPQRD